MNLFLVFATALSVQFSGLIRHYFFDEGEGNEVENHVVIEEGARAESGGILGSLSICGTTPYGMENVHSYKQRDTNAIESVWCAGRIKNKSALRVGTYKVGLYKSGITGHELTNGFTFAGWIKFESGKKNSYASCYPLRLGTGVCDDGFILSWMQAPDGENGTLSFRVGQAKGNGSERSAYINLQNCKSDIWHAFACSMDGTKMRLWLDGRFAETNAANKLIPLYKAGSWTGNKPFTGTTDIHCLHIGNRINSSEPLPFTIDELAVFNRALSVEEVSSFLMRYPASGTEQEQRLFSLKERRARESSEKIEMSIPVDSNGYFRKGSLIPVKVRWAPKGAMLDLLFETTKGNVRFNKTLNADEGGNIDWSFSESVCDAYNLFLVLKDASGRVLKKTSFVIGIVPIAPDHLNSPFGFWAMEEDFNYDSNLRRTDIPIWGGMIQTNAYLAKHERHLKLQKIPASDLREYGFLPYNCGLDLPQGHKLTESEKVHIRRSYTDIAQLAAKYGMNEFEVTSEVDGRTTPDIYIQLLDLVKETLDKTHGKGRYKIYPPGATPCAIPFINKILDLGAAKYVDGVSHHNYLSNPVYNFYWDNPGARLKEVVEGYSKKTGRNIRMYNTESGVFSLPYVKNRPMTREHARTVGYNISHIGGYESYTTSMPSLPDDEAAAIQVHAIFVNLASGYEMYVKCQTPMLQGALPCQQGVALTALSGQVLNDMTAIRTVKLSSLKTLAVLLDREHPKTKKRTNCFSIFGMEKKTFTFRVTPNAVYKTMSLLGNFGEIKADENGVLKISSSMEPIYIFDVPDNIAELASMKIALPSELPEDGVMKGEVVLENPFNKSLSGVLQAASLRGAEIKITKEKIVVKPGEVRRVPFELRAHGLKKRNYSVRISYGALAAEAVFSSNGLVYVIPQAKSKFALDGDESKWDGIPEIVCDTEDDVVHGKPNFAEQWLPQWMNADDLSFSLRTCYVRDDAVYFRIDARDQRVFSAPESEKGLEFRYDCLEFFIDTRRGKALGSPVDIGADQVIVPVVDSERFAKSSIWSVKKDKSHVKVEVVGGRTEKGWMLEGKVVPTKESSLKLRPGSRLMMDFIVDDCDSSDQLRKSAMAVHGMFNNNSNVAGWGRYELGL